MSLLRTCAMLSARCSTHADECVHASAELDQGIGAMQPHEFVGGPVTKTVRSS
jgi:hypothetical protein